MEEEESSGRGREEDNKSLEKKEKESGRELAKGSCVFKPKGYNIVKAALANRQVVMEMSSIILAS